MNARRNLSPQTLTLPSGYDVVYRDWGEGVPLVFLHGLMGNHRHWLGLMQKLKGQYRCIAIDLLGFGESSQPQGSCGIDGEVAFVRQVIEALGLDRYVMVGHSLGGWISAAYAYEFQAEMLAMVLVAPAGIHDRSFTWHYRYRLPLTWPFRWVDWGLLLALKLHRSRFGRTAGWSDRISTLKLERQALLEQPMARQFVRDRALDLDNGPEWNVESKLPAIQLPTLVVAGEDDKLIPLWHCQRYVNGLPLADLKKIPTASHRLPIEHWREMLPVIQNYLTGLNV